MDDKDSKEEEDGEEEREKEDKDSKDKGHSFFVVEFCGHDHFCDSLITFVPHSLCLQNLCSQFEFFMFLMYLIR